MRQNFEIFPTVYCQKKFVFKNSLKKHLEKGRCDVLKQQKSGNRLKLVKPDLMLTEVDLDLLSS